MESEIGKGSVFQFQIPIQRSDNSYKEAHLGVNFVYGEEDGLGQNRSPISVADLKVESAAVPLELLDRLAESTELSDAAMIDQAIEKIRLQNAELGNALSDMAENFAYDEILTFVKKTRIFK